MHNLNPRQYSIIRDFIWAMAPGEVISMADMWKVPNLDMRYQCEIPDIVLSLVQEGVLVRKEGATFERSPEQWDLIQREERVPSNKRGEAFVQEKRKQLSELCAANSGEVYRFLLGVLQGSITYAIKNEDGKTVLVTELVPTAERIKMGKYLFDKAVPSLKSVEVRTDKASPLTVVFELPEPVSSGKIVNITENNNGIKRIH